MMDEDLGGSRGKIEELHQLLQRIDLHVGAQKNGNKRAVHVPAHIKKKEKHFSNHLRLYWWEEIEVIEERQVLSISECYKSEDILDCRGDAIKFFSGEIDPSINRVLMNHIMTSEQIENVRMKASCVFELSLSGKELCDTVQGKIIVLNGEECSSYKLKMIAMFLFVVVSCLLSFSHGGSVVTNTAECYKSEDILDCRAQSVVTNTAECYKSEDILDCRGDAIKFFSGEIDPSINRKLKMIAMFLFVVVSCLLSFSHGGSVVTNTAECYKSEDILDCRGDAIKFFSGEIDPSINRVLMNHIMTSEQIENHGKVLAANIAECYKSEDILDCRGDAIKFFSGEIDPSIHKEELPVNDTSDQGRKPSTGTSWGSSRLPPSVIGPPSQKSPNKSPASSKSNTPDTSPIKGHCRILVDSYGVFICVTDEQGYGQIARAKTLSSC
ncbi:FNBP1 [Mytilus edulis]|uniref:FNBP1 n=1 Tax=Mytilus edulis TaxID=6550 RepID=A0A8S3V8J0_MYTED|nr:FNBP1 [Mytilus edulis]